MKKIFVLILITLAISNCKRKLKEKEPNGTLMEYAYHCYNDKLDSLELEKDCGWSCSPCKMATPTCEQNTNSVFFNSFEDSVTSPTAGTNPSNSSYYEFTGYTLGGFVTIRIPGKKPNMALAHTIQSSFNPNQGEAYVQINTATYGSLNGIAGTVFVNEKNGKYFAVVCNVTFHSSATSSNYSACRINITQP